MGPGWSGSHLEIASFNSRRPRRGQIEPLRLLGQATTPGIVPCRSRNCARITGSKHGNEIIELSGILDKSATHKEPRCLNFAYLVTKLRSFAVRHNAPAKRFSAA